MVDQKHIINTQVLEVKLSSKKEVHLIQDAFSKAYKSHIIPTFERIADRFTQNGEIIKIDKFEIDIGGIDINNIDNDLPLLFEKKLEDKLIEELHIIKLENISLSIEKSVFFRKEKEFLSIKTEYEDNEDVFSHFLQVGDMPWWSNKKIQEIADELLDKSPEKVKKIILKQFKNQNVRKRFIYQFSQNTINKTLLVLLSSKASFFLDFIDKIIAVQSIHPFIILSHNKFKEEIWDITFAYIAENHSSLYSNQLNDIELMKHIFSRLMIQTQNDSISNNELYKFISKISNSIIISKHHIHNLESIDSVIKLLLKILNNPEINESIIADQTTLFKSDAKIQIELITHFLQTGKIFINDRNYSNSEIQQIVEDLLVNSPDKLSLLLLNQLTDLSVRKRFIHQFSDEFIFKILKTIIPSEANSIIELIKNIYKIQLYKPFNNIAGISFREDIWNLIIIHIAKNYQSNISSSRCESESIIKILTNQLIRISNGEISLNEILETLESPDKTELQNNINKVSLEKFDFGKINSSQQYNNTKEIDNRNSTIESNLNFQPLIESKYINNAGLSLLWPFLNIFFVRLNIVKDKKFISSEAAHRAIHLIQYLVTEKEETPEYELLFNKLLCGIDIYEPIPLGIKITDSEKEECNALLQSVIDNWTVLKNTSIHALRDTFLQKEGILSKQPNGWKLTIERTTVDVLLDRLPWSISMIVLPWSNEMIYVEW